MHLCCRTQEGHQAPGVEIGPEGGVTHGILGLVRSCASNTSKPREQSGEKRAKVNRPFHRWEMQKHNMSVQSTTVLYLHRLWWFQLDAGSTCHSCPSPQSAPLCLCCLHYTGRRPETTPPRMSCIMLGKELGGPCWYVNPYWMCF